MAQLKLKLASESRKRIRRGVIFIIVIFGLILINQWKPISQFTQSIQASLTTAAKGIAQIYTNTFTKKDDLRIELENYKALAADLSLNEAHLNELERSVAELENLIEYKQTITSGTTTARVIARSVEDELTILIDKGFENGIMPNRAVVIEAGHIIGFTKDVRRHSSIVILIEHPSSKIPAAIIGNTTTIGLVEGREGFLLHMSFIPQDEEININDVVITSGLDGNFPSGLVIGVISEVVQNETSAFKEALIQPIVDEEFYSYVLVIDPLTSTYAE
ncbi:MAG: rod shape-determining protein MreC [Patescibacteria group bacterium]